MSQVINVWKIKCLTDNTHEEWKLYDTDPAPTTCPVNSAHTVDLNDVTLRHVISHNLIKIQEEDVPTGGKWKARSFWFQGTTGPSETINQIVWKNPVSVFNVQYKSREQNEGDQAHLYIETKDAGYGVGVIGVLQAHGATGATGIYVDQTVIDNVLKADYIQLAGGGNATDYMRIHEIDRENKILYFDEGLPFYFDATSPTFIKFRRYVFKDYWLGPADLYQLGNGKIGGSWVDAGNIVNVVYKNNDSNSDKNLFCYIEYLE